MTPPIRTLGDALSELRIRSGISSGLMAVVLNVSEDKIKKWELDLEIPSRDALLLLGTLLGPDGEASRLLSSAKLGQLTRDDEIRIEGIEANPAYEVIIRARKTYQAVSSLGWYSNDQATLEAQLANIRTLLQVRQEQPSATNSSSLDTDALVTLVAQAQQTAQRLTANVILPRSEDMEVRLVTASSLDRLEEYRSEEQTWGSMASLFIGAIIGIFVNVATGGQLQPSAWVFIGVCSPVAIFLVWTANKYRNRVERVKNNMLRGPAAIDQNLS